MYKVIVFILSLGDVWSVTQFSQKDDFAAVVNGEPMTISVITTHTAVTVQERNGRERVYLDPQYSVSGDTLQLFIKTKPAK